MWRRFTSSHACKCWPFNVNLQIVKKQFTICHNAIWQRTHLSMRYLCRSLSDQAHLVSYGIQEQMTHPHLKIIWSPHLCMLSDILAGCANIWRNGLSASCWQEKTGSSSQRVNYWCISGRALLIVPQWDFIAFTACISHWQSFMVCCHTCAARILSSTCQSSHTASGKQLALVSSCHTSNQSMKHISKHYMWGLCAQCMPSLDADTCCREQ